MLAAWGANEFGCGWMWMAAVMTSTRNIKKDQKGMLLKTLGTWNWCHVLEKVSVRQRADTKRSPLHCS